MRASGSSGTPLFDGFIGIFGEGFAAELLALFGLIGLVASFFTIIFAYGRNTYSLSRAGYFPKFLSMTHGMRKTPHVALIAGAVVGYAVFFLVWALQQQELGAQIVAALLNMAVFGAVISYVMQMLSFILLRRKLPNIDRPYRSKWGVPGAAIAGIIALVSLVTMFTNDDYRPGLYGVAALLRPRRALLRDRRTEPPRAVAGGGVRPHAGRARHSGGVLRPQRRGAGGDPPRRTSTRGAAPDSPRTTIRLAHVRNAASGGPVQGPPLAFDSSHSRTFDSDPGPKGGRT